MLWAVKDVVFLLSRFVLWTWRIAVDSAWHALRPSPTIPSIDIKALSSNPKALSVLLSREVVEVETRKIAGVVGDDAIGTDRAWVRVRFSDSDKDHHLFIKVPSCRVWLRSLLSLTGLYQNELAFCVHTAPKLAAAFPMPKILCARMQGTRFVLVEEDLSQSGCKLLNLFETCTKEEVLRVLDTLARLHAQYWMRADEVWDESRRPPFVRLLVQATLGEVKRRFPGLLPGPVEQAYRQFLQHYGAVRAFWDRAPTTFVHGDTHIGNLYFRPNGSCGFYDFQVVSRESPLRDVTYFLQMSCDPDMLGANEKEFVRVYLDKLNAELAKTSPGTPRLAMESAWFQYRMHTFYSLTAFIFTCGAADFVQQAKSVREIARRAVSAAERVQCDQALRDMLAGQFPQ